MTLDEQFPENSVMTVVFDSRKLCAAACECASIIFMETKLPIEKRNLTPGLREAIRKMYRVDVDNRREEFIR